MALRFWLSRFLKIKLLYLALLCTSECRDPRGDCVKTDVFCNPANFLLPLWQRVTVPRFLYVANQGSASVSIFSIDPSTGRLTSVDTLATAATPRQVTVSPTGRFAYITQGGSQLVTYSIQVNGVLTQLDSIGTVTGPLILEPFSRFGYALNSGIPAVNAYSVNSATGLLAVVGSPGAVGAGATDPVVDPSGRSVYTCNNGAANISMFSVGQSGAVTFLGNALAGANVRRGTFDSLGRYFYASNFGTTTISEYTWDSSGNLTVLGTATGLTSPQEPVVDPMNRFVLATSNGSPIVYTFPIQSNGLLGTSLTQATGTNPRVPVFHPSGKYVYIVNAGGTNVSAYSMDSTGALTQIGSAGALTSPQQLVMEPNGKFFYVPSLNQTLSIFQIDSSGIPTEIGTASIGTTPAIPTILSYSEF